MGTSLGKNSALLMSKSAITSADGVDLVSEALINEKRAYEGGAEGLQGGRQLDVADEICVAEAPGGNFSYRPRYTDLSLLMELALGEGSDTAWTPLESGELPTFKIEIQKSDAYAELHEGCRLSELTLRSEQNGPLTAEANVIATSCAEESTPTTPTYAGVGGVAPIMHNDLVITGDAGITGLKPFSLQVHINNNMDGEGFANSKNRQFMETEGFDCDLEMEVSLDSTIAGNIADWYDATPKTPLEIITTYSSGTKSLAITFRGIITSPQPTIDSPGKQRVTLAFAGRATWAGSPYEITEDMISVAVDDS